MAIPVSYNVRNLVVRKSTTAMTALGIASTVAVFVALLALVDGLRLSLTASSDPRHVIVMRKGATAELNSNIERTQFRDISLVPGVARTDQGAPMASLEMVTVVMLESPDRPDGINITLRGLLPIGIQMRSDVKIVEGRAVSPGSRELVVGKGIAARYPMARPGKTLRLGRGDWNVVGVFDAGRSAASSELWGDLDQVCADFNRMETQSSVLLRAPSPEAVPDLVTAVESDRRFSVKGWTEKAYYDQQTSSAMPIQAMGTLVAFVMAIGSCFAAMNTMYAAVARRAAEIGTLRALGFSRWAVLASFVLESLLLSGLGGLIGILAAFPLNGLQTGIGSSVSFSELTFAFHVGPRVAATGLIFALVMGVLGGFLPAWAAAQKPIATALRDS